MDRETQEICECIAEEMPPAALVRSLREAVAIHGEECVTEHMLAEDYYLENGCPAERVAVELRRTQRALTALYPERN